MSMVWVLAPTIYYIGQHTALQGAYLNIDEFKSKFQVLCNKLCRQDYPVKRVFNQQST